MDNPRSIDKFLHPNDYPATQSQSYALSGKIMLTAIVVLFSVVVIMVCLHLYARWYLLRTRRRNLLLRNSRRRTHLVFYAVDPNNPSALQATRGLDASVLKSLPVFDYSSSLTEELLECAVCLSDFEEGEKGRTLPKCNHSFHIECIDMWFQSHSTCPICRSPVEPVVNSDVVVKVDDEPVEQTGSSSGATCQQYEERSTASTTSSSSFRARRKEMIGVSEIEIPTRRNESFGRSENESPMSQFRSPGNTMRSLKRILSRSRMISPSSGPNNEEDLERGKEDSMSQRSRVQTPR